MENEINDWKHRLLVNEHIKLLHKRFSVYPNSKIDVEVPFCYYGLNGVIDILETDSDRTCIYEIKPLLINLNEGIRQLKKAKEYFLKIRNSDIQLYLVTYCSEENIKIYLDNIETLIVGKISVWFYTFDNDKNIISSCGIAIGHKLLKIEGNNIIYDENQADLIVNHKFFIYNNFKRHIFDIAKINQFKL